MPQARESCFYSPVREKKRVSPSGWQTARPDSRLASERQCPPSISLRPNSPRRASSASRFQKPKPRILFAQARSGALCPAPFLATQRKAMPSSHFPPAKPTVPGFLRFTIQKPKPSSFLHRQGAARFALPPSWRPSERQHHPALSLRPSPPCRASSALRFQTPKPRILCAGPAAAPACFASRLYKPAGNSPSRQKFPNHWPAPWSSAASRPVPPRSSAASSASGRTASARAFISPASACVCSSRRARAGASSAVKTP